jgi:hypothetical protein
VGTQKDFKRKLNTSKRVTKIAIWLAGCATSYRNHRKMQMYKISEVEQSVGQDLMTITIKIA